MLSLNPFKMALILLGSAGLLFSVNADAGAEEVRLVPNLSLRQQFTDNYRYSSQRKEAAMSILVPGIELGVKTERLEATASVSLECLLSFVRNEGYLGALNRNYAGTVSYLTTPTTHVSGTATYLDLPNPDRPLTVNGVLISPASFSQQLLGVSGGWRISELLGSVMQYDYSRYDFSPPTSSTNTTNSVSTGLTYDLGEGAITQVSMSTGLARYSFDSSSQQSSADNYYLTVGANHSLSERWRLSADAGGRYTRSAYSMITGNSGAGPTSFSAGWGFVAHLDLNYHDERTTAALITKHDLEPGVGNAAATNTTAVYLTATHRYTEDFSTSLTAGYTKQTTGRVNSTIQGADQDVVSIAAGVSCKVTPDLAAEVSYQFTRSFYSAPQPDIYRNTAYVGLTWKKNLFD